MNTTERRKAARGYIKRGVSPIPVRAGGKNPVLEGWENLQITAGEVDRYWTNGQNVGVLTGEPSGWFVDVDLDSEETVKLSGRFLSPTLTSGRKERPHSHWWYRSPNLRSRDFNDTDGRKKLLEIRSTGRQTVVAPSVHPSGDEYVWHSESGLPVLEIEAAKLEESCKELATAALIGRHLPEHRDHGGGGRHEYALALVGFLLRPGRLDIARTLKILKAAWDTKRWPGEREKAEAHRSLKGIVSDTARNLAGNRPVVGGTTLDEMQPGIVRQLYGYWGWERQQAADSDEIDDKRDRRNQADRLIGYALEDLDGLFVDQHGAPHALVDGGPLPLNSRCYSWLRRLKWLREKRAVNGEYLKTATGTLAAHAEFSGEVRELHTRAAWHEGTLYYELRPGRVVEVRGDGWGFSERPPVLFRRYPNLKPLPDPEHGGSAKDLAGYANLKTGRDKRLFTAYAATVPLEHVGRPILNASGAMGSGKTSVGRLVKRTWDPTAPETIRLDPRDILQKASHAFVLMLDNQNAIPEWAADTLCRLVTGEADSKRRLYTDDEDVIIELRRAVLLNGINVPTDRGDVLDRSLVVELERIPDAERKTEEELWERFGREHPRLLGALLDVLSKAIALKPTLQLSRRPRLADWGEYAASVYEVMGWGAETFLDDWDEVVMVQNQATLDGSPVAQCVLKFMEGKTEHAASASELHKVLSGVAEDLGVARDKAWPKSARWLWRRIKEVLPLLAAAGIDASRRHTDKGTTIILRQIPKGDVNNVSEGKPAQGKAKTADNTIGLPSGPNATSESDVRANVSRDPAACVVSDNTRNPDIRSGDLAERVRAFLREPPEWYRRQAEECVRRGTPERLLKPLASTVAQQALGSTRRRSEVVPYVAAALMGENSP